MNEQGNADQGLRIISYLISGLVFYGGLGWLADHLLSTAFWLPIGLILGTVAGIYLVIKRYGRA
ncbi:AtpZ/AtpI family protein [Nigerium massiliense]|uniref:AtpZ/AtpI family protein n=1 Tax=Nigerium massiliense TaxID=1522317 RepID=UPI000590E168|nr:AtpZ/AtpI family protein [Nigerium massiliense]